ncbi:UTP--glucose-1-phosphate uridylyltransferase [bacterium]|nr:UTP--glucose-1-phosphate uridylyltransferase [bacterium]
MDINKVIIPAAGLGTRFLPWTKAVPKEMLPLLDKPAIQYIIEECLTSQITNFSIVNSKSKQALESHFDSNTNLELILKERNKTNLIASTEKIFRHANFTYVRQTEPLGLGHAIWTARNTIGKEYFGVILPDELFFAKNPGIKQLIDIARQERASVIAVQEVPMNSVSSYGIIGIKKQITPKLFQVSQLIEKPKQKEAPSNLAIIGRYVLSHKLFNSLEKITPYATEELQLTDGINHMLKHGEKVFAYKIQGSRYDIGKPIGWIKAIIGRALQDQRYAPALREYLKDLDASHSFLYDNDQNLIKPLPKKP